MLSLRDGLGCSPEALKPDLLGTLSLDCHRVLTRPLGGGVNSKYFVSSMILLEMFSNFLKVMMTCHLLLQTPYSIFSVIPVSQES